MRAIDYRPDYAEAHNAVGIGLAREGRLQEAIDPLNKAVRFKKDYAEARYNLGIVQVQGGGGAMRP